jgi:heat-inducible transcriptional repressor
MTGDAPSLSPRQDAILCAVCRDYIVGGGEVSSSALVQRHGFRWSRATMRQELAALEHMGYLRRPHRSAGCTPSRRGLQHFAARLPAGTGPGADVVAAVEHSLRRLRTDPSLGSSRDLARGMRATACVLSEVSGCLAVTFLGSTSEERIEQVDVVRLVGPRALVVLSLPGNTARMQPVDLAHVGDGTSADDEWPLVLERLQARLRSLCVGRTLAGAREELASRLHAHEAQVDRLLAQALRVGLAVCTADALDPLFMEVAGQPALVRGTVDLDRLGDVLALLEDDQRLARVLCQLLPEPDGGAVRAEVRVGAEGLVAPTGDGEAPGLALVGCRLPVRASAHGEGAERGAVVLIGPDRMDYAVVIPLVEYAARALAARVGA